MSHTIIKIVMSKKVILQVSWLFKLKVLQIAKENSQNAQNRQKSTYDRKHSSPNAFAVGQLVLRKDSEDIGPYLITKCHSKGISGVSRISVRGVLEGDVPARGRVWEQCSVVHTIL